MDDKINVNKDFAVTRDGQLRHKLSGECSDFNNYLFNNSKFYSMTFFTTCPKVGVYLDHILRNKLQKKPDFNTKANCNYFFYILKNVVQNYGDNCSTTENCYCYMRTKKNPNKISYPAQFSDVCKEEDNVKKYIDKDLFHVLRSLDELHDILNKLKTASSSNYSDFEKFKGHFKSLEGCKYKINGSFKLFLQIHLKYLYEINNSFIKYYNFNLLQYTNYESYLQSRVRMLRKMLKKNNKK
ncbi:variable surface protein [Plasmodium gonderi]|uniref:Variable surface protein n=1 Tax=Plasmodium gonderi TaxID=77519 RepID=A0A1Y1JMB2_PLAGO|nr:variable surface protein [Plasmodium gonderi]GAW82738.1 variable surface protein [Plasmodium gonderi]